MGQHPGRGAARCHLRRERKAKSQRGRGQQTGEAPRGGSGGAQRSGCTPPAGSQEVPAPEPEPPPLCPPLFIEGHEATELDRAQFPADPAAASALEVGIGHARAVLPVPEAAEPRFPPRAAHKSINSKVFIIFFSCKQPKRAWPRRAWPNPGQKKRAVAPPGPCAHHRGLAAPAWPRAEVAGTRLPVCVLRAPSSFYFFSPNVVQSSPEMRRPPPTSNLSPRCKRGSDAPMHHHPPESDLQSLGRARSAKRSRGGCTGLAPVLFLPVSPHGLVVFHHDAELGPRVQRRALQVPFEALQGRRGERASGGKLSPKAGDFHRFSPRVN